MEVGLKDQEREVWSHFLYCFIASDITLIYQEVISLFWGFLSAMLFHFPYQ